MAIVAGGFSPKKHEHSSNPPKLSLLPLLDDFVSYPVFSIGRFQRNGPMPKWIKLFRASTALGRISDRLSRPRKASDAL